MPLLRLIIDRTSEKRLPLFDFDDEVTLVTRAAVLLGRLPETLRIESLVLSGPHAKLEIRTVESEIGELKTLPDLSSFRSKYPLITKGQLGCILMKEAGGVPAPSTPLFKLLREMSRTFFPSGSGMSTFFEDYKRTLPLRLKAFVEEATAQERVLNELFSEDSPTFSIGDFQLEETSREYTLRLTRSIEEIFDRFAVSYEIPLAVLRTVERSFLKVVAGHSPTSSRLEEINSYDEGLYFDFRLSGTKLFPAKLSKDGDLTVLFPKDASKKASSYFDRWRSSIDVRLDVVGNRDQTVKGYFSIPRKFSKVVTAHLIALDPIISSFLSLEEREKTSLEKNRFYSIYLNGTSRLTLLFLPDEKGFDLRVLNAKSVVEIERFVVVFIRLYSRIESLTEEVEKLYGPLIDTPRVRKGSTASIKTSRERSSMLRSVRPELFQTGYPTVCQKTKQPYLIVGAEKAEELRLRFIETNTDPDVDPSNKIIEYPTGSGDYYACEPREPSDSSQKEIWPGLQINKSLGNKDTHPFLPCCFTIDQVAKAGSTYNKYLSGKGATKKEEGSSYVLASNKMPPLRRHALLPFLLEKMAKLGGSPSMIRYGAPYRRDSLIFCLEIARDASFMVRDDESIELGMTAAKKKFLDLLPLHFPACLTEFPGMTLADATDQLRDGFLNPKQWCSFFERVLKIPIFVFEITLKVPEGAFARPHFVERFLPAPIPEGLNGIGLVMFETGDVDNPWQTEILCPISGKFLINGLLLNKLRTFRERAFVSTGVRVDEKIFDDAVGVIPDRSGAIRVVNYSDHSLVVPPVRNTRGLPIVSLSDLQIAKKGVVEKLRSMFDVMAIDRNESVATGLELEVFGVRVYLPTLPFELDEVDRLLPKVRGGDPVRDEGESALFTLRRSEKISRIYLAYAKLLASIRKGMPKDSDFIVEEGFDVPVAELDNQLKVDEPMMKFDGEKWCLKVPSADLIPRLRSSVKVALLNDREGTLDFSSRTSIPGTYVRVSDFSVHFAETLLLLSDVDSIIPALSTRR